MPIPIPWIEDEQDDFPPIESALREPNGLLAAGGDLSVARLLTAYSRGIFPWFEDGQPVLWWSPDPRMVLRPGEMHISASMRKLLNRNLYEVTMDTAFREVVHNCAFPRRKASGTWITTEMQRAYARLHDAGFAHSVEVWFADKLVGGMYGVSLGSVFFGESMFSSMSNTSKLALAYLTKQLHLWNFKLLDCQVSSAHLESLGAVEISRVEFARELGKYAQISASSGKWHLQPGFKW